jgi:hypothetical protein
MLRSSVADDLDIPPRPAISSRTPHRSGEAMQVTLFQAAAGPQIGSAIVAMQYESDPQLIALMV